MTRDELITIIEENVDFLLQQQNVIEAIDAYAGNIYNEAYLKAKSEVPKSLKYKSMNKSTFRVKENNLNELESFVSSFGDNYSQYFQFIDGGPDGASLKLNGLNIQPDDLIIRGDDGGYGVDKSSAL